MKIRLQCWRGLGIVSLSAAGILLLSSCGGGSSSTVALPPGSASQPPPEATASNPISVHISTVALPGNGAYPEILAVDASGAVYFGSTGATIPGFCLDACAATGSSPGLTRYDGSTFTATSPHGPYFENSGSFTTCNGQPIPNDSSCSFGGVSAINALDFSSAIWASDYAPDASSILFSELQWGGRGGTATEPPTEYNHDFASSAGEILSILKAPSGQVWVAGVGPQGPQIYPASVPVTCQSQTCDMLLLANGPNGDVWAMTRTYPQNPIAPNGSVFFEFDPSGSLKHTYTTPDVAIRIAGSQNNLWFTDYAHNAVGKLDANGKVTEYPVPTANAGVNAITVASDGSVWFAESNASKVGRLDSAGHIDEYAVPFQPWSIASTPPGCITAAVWVGSDGSKAELAKITYGS